MKKNLINFFFYIIVFGQEMLALVMVVICTGQYKVAHYKKINNSLSNDLPIMFLR